MAGKSLSLHGRERLSIPEAAKRVHRDRRTIHRWLAAGMPSHEHAGLRHVWLDDLQAAFVGKLATDVTRPRSAAALEHGTRNHYRAGCRCDPCREGNAAHERARYAKRLQETADRRAKAAERVGEPTLAALPRPCSRREQQVA